METTDKIFFTSDIHFCHDREFLYKPRGFDSISEMNDAIVERWNNVVGKEDTVYILGDLMLCNNEMGVELLCGLNGMKRIIRGNHDTDNRVELYRSLPNVLSVEDAAYFKWNGYKFFLTHFPCLTGSLEHSDAKHTLINLFGHTHSKLLFYEDRPYMYNVAMDAHNSTPVCISEIVSDIEKNVEECKAML